MSRLNEGRERKEVGGKKERLREGEGGGKREEGGLREGRRGK